MSDPSAERHPLGSTERPLRVAIVGAGPSGFYAAEHLLKSGRAVAVDLYERLPAPYGLVRYGVAPDHQKIKRVVRAYDRVLEDERVRFFGNVTIGRDVSLAELDARYDATVLTYGSATDRRLGIPGEDLDGSWSATEFVGWYNGDPDFQDRRFDLARVRDAVVVGVGNVALDVARVLARDVRELADTDITNDALAALRGSALQRVTLLGRRGPAQAKFSPSELREIIRLDGVASTVDPHPVELDPVSEAWLETAERSARTNLDLLAELPAAPPAGEREIALRFCLSPVEILADDAGHVRAVVVERNAMVDGPRGPSPSPTGERFEIPCQAVFRSVGYRGAPMDGAPFDERTGTVPNSEGRVLDRPGGAPVPGLYVAGWIKRGPSGLIGTNKADAIESVDALLADLDGRTAPADAEWPPRLCRFLHERVAEVFDTERWQELDRWELQRGEACGKVREKAVTVDEMVAATSHPRDRES